MKSIIFVLLLLNIQLHSQSLNETQNWIVQKHNNYCSKEYISYGVTYPRKTTLEIKDGYLIYNNITANFIQKVKIKDIKTIEVIHYITEESDEGYKMQLICFETKDNYFDGLTLFFGKNFETNDMKNRMIKAMIQLVKLYGGNAKVKKEAF